MSQLPEGWIETSFMEVFDIQGGTQPPKAQFKYEPLEGFIRLLQIRDFGDRPVPTYIPNESGLKICNKDDILIGRYGASVGRICTGMEGAYNVALAKVILPKEIDNRFVFYLLKSDLFQRLILATERSAQDGFNKDDLEKMSIPLIPLAEQRRIVAKLEMLFSKVETCQQGLAKIPVSIKRFRQAVLAAACSGELTGDWREIYRHSSTRGRNRDFDELPASWTTKRVKELAKSEKGSIQSGPFGSSLLHSEFQEAGVLAIGIDNILDGKFSLGKQHRISHEKYEELKKYTARPLDVLITVMATVGRCCVVPEEIETAIITKHVYRISCEHKLVNPRYLLNCLRGSAQVQSQIQAEIIGATRPGINGSILKEITVPLPPIEEQKEIVHRVDALLQLADQIEARYQKAKSQVDRLQQSILTKAFRGELVPTEAELARKEGREYEPAAILLERIRAERISEQTKPKRTLNLRKPAMNKVTKETVKEVIGKFPQERFSFDDLRKKVPADYESLKEILFALLSETEPYLMQVFDKDANAMRFIRSHR